MDLLALTKVNHPRRLTSFWKKDMLSHKIEYFATFDKDFEIVFEKGILKKPLRN